jgi:hypothetical protein
VIVGFYTDASLQDHGFVASRATRRDFYGAGNASVLWRNGSGLSSWNMFGSSAGSTIFSSGAVTWQGQTLNPDASWSVAGNGDFNGDGFSDLLWRQSSGALSLWHMHGSQVASSATVTYQGNAIAPDVSWSIAGIGDFNGNGKADMLWRQSNGTIALWLMNDSSVTSSSAITYQGNALNPDASWKVVEVADFDGDGHTDILWRNDNGAMAEWLMIGSQVTASVTPGVQGNAVSPDASWSVQGKATMFG